MRNLPAIGKGDGRIEIGSNNANVEITFFDSGTDGRPHLFSYASESPANADALAERIWTFLSEIVRQQFVEHAFAFNRSVGKEV